MDEKVRVPCEIVEELPRSLLIRRWGLRYFVPLGVIHEIHRGTKGEDSYIVVEGWLARKEGWA